MISRISDSARFSTATGNISGLQHAMNGVSQQLATQKKINQPSDDPDGAKTVLNLRTAGAAIDQYKTNVTSGETWLKTTALHLNSINDLLTLARGVAQNAAGESAADKVAAADSVQTITNQVLALANGELGGRYLFSGTKTDTPPFTVNGATPPAYVYNGDTQSLNINIGQNSSTAYNLTGDAVGGGVSLFETLDALQTALRADVGPDITSSLADLETAGGLVQDSISKTSAMLNNLEFTNNHLTYLSNKVAGMISNREDTDTAQLAMEFQMQALALNATYSVTAKMNESSILNLLR